MYMSASPRAECVSVVLETSRDAVRRRKYMHMHMHMHMYIKTSLFHNKIKLELCRALGGCQDLRRPPLVGQNLGVG